MSRSKGFAVADIDVGLFADRKVRRLAPALHDEAMIVYLRLVLESWGSGCALAAEDVLEREQPEAVEELVRVGLLDAVHVIPNETWQGWYGVAFARRLQAAERQRKYRDGATLKERVEWKG